MLQATSAASGALAQPPLPPDGMQAGIQMGVYRLYDLKTQQSFIGFSRNLAGIKKRMRFELTLNASPYAALQQAFCACGGLTFEVLETYAPNLPQSDEELDAHLLALAIRQQEAYHAHLLR